MLNDGVTLADDHFALLGLPRRQTLDRDVLDANYRDVQQRVHPDRHANAAAADQRLAMQWATQVNEAYRTLRSPLTRARYLLQLLGHDVQSESNTAMPAAFLVEQMELREALDDAKHSRGDTAASTQAALDALSARLRGDIAAGHRRLAGLIDDTHDYVAAAALVRQLMFQEKLNSEIDDAIDALSH